MGTGVPGSLDFCSLNSECGLLFLPFRFCLSGPATFLGLLLGVEDLVGSSPALFRCARRV